jgi:hypothetical protein
MKRCFTWFIVFAVLLLVTLACSLSGKAEPTETAPPPPPIETPEPTPTTDPYAGIEHTDLPGDPILTYWAYDCDTGRYSEAIDKPTIGGGCNVWENNFIERPVNADASLYYPHLDITRFQMGKDDSWLYADIKTFSKEGLSTSLNGTYGIEFDFDVDSNGDVLLFVVDPSQFAAGEWHALGVQVWEDANEDVGSTTPVLADEENTGDGYENMLFDQGLGDDPDLAWARIDPDDPATIQLAIKRSIIPPGVGAFVWWTWASQEPLVPDQFDYNDTYGEDEVYQIGNSCRWIFDGPPQPVPNVCPYKEPTPEPTYCWVRSNSVIAVFPAVCQICPNPCPAGYSCYGSCEP